VRLPLPLLLLAMVLSASASAAPTPTINASAAVGPAPLTVQFQAAVTVPDPAPALASYAWSFGDGGTATGVGVTHRFVKPGLYTVALTVTDALGGFATSTTQIRAQGLRLALAPSNVVFGRRVVARGAIAPAAAGVRVTIARRVGSSWQAMKTARTDSAGRFSAGLLPGHSGIWQARIGSLHSTPVGLTVAPRLDVQTGAGTAFLGASVLIRARPRTRAPATVTVLRGSLAVGHARGAVGDRFMVPTPGVGSFAARVKVAGRTVTVPLRASARTLASGSTGPDVLALRARLAQLRVHVPWPSVTFGPELSDAVTAFQKVRGLDRTGVVDDATWRALGQDAVPSPRYRMHDTHIEVSKSRQILMVVHDGETETYLPVSSGAGGITPVGNYRIRWKSPSTTTWLGSAILYRTMTFRGNSYAIHGFPSVPAYPASHGCVRIPIWLADWLYQRTPVGERVYVYE
jgi:N-acetylmuramoyl-L-alanine amidase